MVIKWICCLFWKKEKCGLRKSRNFIEHITRLISEIKDFYLTVELTATDQAFKMSPNSDSTTCFFDLEHNISYRCYRRSTIISSNSTKVSRKLNSLFKREARIGHSSKTLINHFHSFPKNNGHYFSKLYRKGMNGTHKTILIWQLFFLCFHLSFLIYFTLHEIQTILI